MLTERLALLQSDALLLGENAETQALLQTLASDTVRDIGHRAAAADTFARTAWTGMGSSYRSIELRGPRDSLLIQLSAATADSTLRVVEEAQAVSVPIRHDRTGKPLGRVVLHPTMSALISPSQLRSLAFGHTGYLQVLDRTNGSVLIDSRDVGETSGLYPSSFAFQQIGNLVDSATTARYVERDTQRLAAVERVTGSEWMVVSSASIGEFTSALSDSGARDLLFVILFAVVLAFAFTILIGRTTRSYEALTIAARNVARGDLKPVLPAVSPDEAGALVSAFDLMLTQVRAMMREIEASRQMAVLGEFSAQLSHEIRNPLTAIKLNLQALARDVARGHLASSASMPLDTCLLEVNRLDGVVRSVLSLSRSAPAKRRPVHVHDILRRVVAVHAIHLRAANITMASDLRAANDTIAGDDAQLVGLFTNLVVNAIDAQPSGGRIVFQTMNVGEHIEILIADDGPGIPSELADRIFLPFVSGKDAGTGLGLPLAQTAARDHGGRIDVVRSQSDCRGAVFTVQLPLIA